MPTNASRRPALLADAASLILLLACAALLWRLIPYAHWAAMWQDRDFTGWIGPLANRLAAANGARLYEDGFIFPMPPLAILTVLGLTQGRAVWLSETQINYAFVFAMPPLLFLIARLYCSTPRALAAALATLCAFVSLPKQMVYDAEVQFFVTLALGALALRFELAASDRGKLLAADLALALALALAILTKQSTGAFALFGATAALAIHGLVQKRLARGLVEAGAVAVGAALFVAVALVAMSSWASPAGFLEYVLVKGSLPKGGPEKIWANLTGYFDDAALSAGLSLGLILLMEAAARRTPLREMRYSSRQILFSITALALVSDGISWLPLLAGSSPIAARVIVQRAAVFGGFQKLLLIIVLAGAACSILEARLSNRRWLRDWGPRLRQPPGILLVGLDAFSAAIGHNLSVPDFRWGYDNNPLVFFVALSATGIVGSTLLRPPRMFQAVTALTLVSLLVYVGLGVADQLRVIAGARIPWPEISELQGVFLRPQGEGARRLTARVRDYAAASDTVLLLPNDPEVESWFERPRPRLSSLILFPDQYLDEKVDEDLARLERDLPKAIVIGPRLGWRRFARNWHPGRGAERFIDRVQAEILPKHYALAETVSVYWERNADMMDIYLRK